MSRAVLVTAGSRGIGRAVVDVFLEQEDTVFATARKTSPSYQDLKSHPAAISGRLHIIDFDAMVPAHYARLVAEVRRSSDGLDVLVNNVGDVVRRSSLIDSDDELWRDTFELNVMSTMRCCRMLFPLLEKTEGAVVINISSIAARTGGGGDSLHYGAAKAAIVAMTRGLAAEWGKYGIRVVGIAPSAIDTDFQRVHSSPDRLAKIVSQTPAGRLGTAEEVAATAHYLASAGAGYVSGETVFLTGGR